MESAALGERWQQQLAAGLERMELHLEADQRQTLVAYLTLLMKWNRAYNLTAVRDPQAVVSRQLLDSLAVLPLLTGRRMLDLGSGPGLPGVPLAVARPDIEMTLLDANSKKCRFLQQVKLELAIANVEIVCARVEHYRPRRPFELVVSRAFAGLREMYASASALLAPKGTMLALKGKLPRAELAELNRLGMQPEVYPLVIPGNDGARHAIRISHPG